jgi:hypothetical protein
MVEADSLPDVLQFTPDGKLLESKTPESPQTSENLPTSSPISPILAEYESISIEDIIAGKKVPTYIPPQSATVAPQSHPVTAVQPANTATQSAMVPIAPKPDLKSTVEKTKTQLANPGNISQALIGELLNGAVKAMLGIDMLPMERQAIGGYLEKQWEKKHPDKEDMAAGMALLTFTQRIFKSPPQSAENKPLKNIPPPKKSAFTKNYPLKYYGKYNR